MRLIARGDTFEALTEAALVYVRQYPELGVRWRWNVQEDPDGGLMAIADTVEPLPRSRMLRSAPPDPTVVALQRERRAVAAALRAMEDLTPSPPAKVRSIRGMERLLTAIFGKRIDRKSPIHWAHQPVARAHRARAWS